jgi:hypothetical protein
MLYDACDVGFWLGEVVSTFATSWFSTVFTQVTPVIEPNCDVSHDTMGGCLNRCNLQNHLTLWERVPKF